MGLTQDIKDVYPGIRQVEYVPKGGPQYVGEGEVLFEGKMYLNRRAYSLMEMNPYAYGGPAGW